MEYKIEKMNRMRKNILLGVLIGTVFAFGLLLYPSINRIFHFTHWFRWRTTVTFLNAGFALWALTLLLFIVRYWLYRKKLKKDHSLRLAVNDERVNLNWLRAYRLAFIVIVGITIFWDWSETDYFPKVLIKAWFPHGPWLIVFGAVISLLGAFLWYNKGAKSEPSLNRNT